MKSMFWEKNEQLELEVEIAASVAKVNVLRGCGGSCVASNATVKSSGMNSYFESGQRNIPTLDADAKPFVPDTSIQPGSQPDLHPLATRPKVRNVAQDLQPQLTLSRHSVAHRSAIKVTQSRPQFQYQSNHLAPLSPRSSDQSHIISVFEKQNEITALLVQQQSLSFLPSRDNQVFDGDSLQYHTFILRAF